MASTDQKGKRRGGFYWIGKTPLVSVTHVLGKIIRKPGLEYWKCQQVYLAVIKDPSISQQEALASPYKTSKKAMGRGTTVHSIVEAYKKGTFDIEDKVMDEYKGYAQAFRKWVEDVDAKIIAREKTVMCKKLGFAGTLDMLATIGKSKLPTLIDVKTGKDIYPEVFLQLSAYEHALLEEGIKVEDRAVLLLHDDGNYKYQIGPDKFKAFIACKTLWEGMNEESLIKIGYLKKETK